MERAEPLADVGRRLLASLAVACLADLALVFVSGVAGVGYFLAADRAIERPLGETAQDVLSWLGVVAGIGVPAVLGALSFPHWARWWRGYPLVTGLLAVAGFAAWSAWALWAISVLNQCTFGLPFPYESAREACSR
jgi:hypothetical protein